MDTIIIGSDHGGFEYKQKLIPHLKGLGYEVKDFGCYSTTAVDYPDIAFLIAQSVSAGFLVNNTRGIMIDGSGVASAIVCNKVPGIRATPCATEFTAESARAHNNSNLLTLGSRVIDYDTTVKIVDKWLTTPYEGGRHDRRVDKIREIERQYLKSK